MTAALVIGAVLAGYAMGSLSPAGVITKRAGLDVRAVGSGNPGATNVGRVLGLRAGVLVAVLDIAKAALPAAVFGTFGRSVGLLAGLAAVVGHVTSPLLRGRGGKGVATTAGAVIGSYPAWAPVVFLVWFLVVGVTRWVALASLCAVASIPMIALATGSGSATLLWAGVLLAIVVGRHRSNLRQRWQRHQAEQRAAKPFGRTAACRVGPEESRDRNR